MYISKILFETLLQIGIIIPFTILLMEKRSIINFRRILIFTFCYISYQIVLVLPTMNENLDFIKSSWNWEGKIFGILWGVISFFLFRKYFAENNYFTLKQDKTGLKKALTGAIGIVLLSTVVWFILGKSDFNIETLAFQLTVPGIDEEIMFRGILLGLLMTTLKNKVPFLGNPSVLLTAVLFGFMHSLTLGKNYSVNFDPMYFFQTGLAGYVWGWITIKSRSILLAILSHNFSNFFGTLSTMIK